jgi:hypothetical protein
MPFSAANPNIRCCFINLLFPLQSRPHHSVCISKPPLHNTRDILHVTDAGFLLKVCRLFNYQFIWCNMPRHCNWFCTFQGNFVVSKFRKRIETVSHPRKKNISAIRGQRAKTLCVYFQMLPKAPVFLLINMQHLRQASIN